MLTEALETLSVQHMEQVTWESDFLAGSIAMEKAGRLILSVPYEAGWHVSVNGQETEGELDLDYCKESHEEEVPYALSNSLGFGGHNASILLGKLE